MDSVFIKLLVQVMPMPKVQYNFNLSFSQNIRNSKVFANFPAKVFFYIGVSGYCRHFSVSYIFIQRVSAAFSKKYAILLFQVLDKFFTFHYRLKERV